MGASMCLDCQVGGACKETARGVEMRVRGIHYVYGKRRSAGGVRLSIVPAKESVPPALVAHSGD